MLNRARTAAAAHHRAAAIYGQPATDGFALSHQRTTVINHLQQLADIDKLYEGVINGVITKEDGLRAMTHFLTMSRGYTLQFTENRVALLQRDAPVTTPQPIASIESIAQLLGYILVEVPPAAFEEEVDYGDSSPPPASEDVASPSLPSESALQVPSPVASGDPEATQAYPAPMTPVVAAPVHVEGAARAGAVRERSLSRPLRGSLPARMAALRAGGLTDSSSAVTAPTTPIRVARSREAHSVPPRLTVPDSDEEVLLDQPLVQPVPTAMRRSQSARISLRPEVFHYTVSSEHEELPEPTVVAAAPVVVNTAPPTVERPPIRSLPASSRLPAEATSVARPPIIKAPPTHAHRGAPPAPPTATVLRPARSEDEATTAESINRALIADLSVSGMLVPTSKSPARVAPRPKQQPSTQPKRPASRQRGPSATRRRSSSVDRRAFDQEQRQQLTGTLREQMLAPPTTWADYPHQESVLRQQSADAPECVFRLQSTFFSWQNQDISAEWLQIDGNWARIVESLQAPMESSRLICRGFQTCHGASVVTFECAPPAEEHVALRELWEITPQNARILAVGGATPCSLPHCVCRAFTDLPTATVRARLCLARQILESTPRGGIPAPMHQRSEVLFRDRLRAAMGSAWTGFAQQELSGEFALELAKSWPTAGVAHARLGGVLLPRSLNFLRLASGGLGRGSVPVMPRSEEVLFISDHGGPISRLREEGARRDEEEDEDFNEGITTGAIEFLATAAATFGSVYILSRAGPGGIERTHRLLDRAIFRASVPRGHRYFTVSGRSRVDQHCGDTKGEGARVIRGDHDSKLCSMVSSASQGGGAGWLGTRFVVFIDDQYRNLMEVLQSLSLPGVYFHLEVPESRHTFDRGIDLNLWKIGALPVWPVPRDGLPMVQLAGVIGEFRYLFKFVGLRRSLLAIPAAWEGLARTAAMLAYNDPNLEAVLTADVWPHWEVFEGETSGWSTEMAQWKVEWIGRARNPASSPEAFFANLPRVVLSDTGEVIPYLDRYLAALHPHPVGREVFESLSMILWEIFGWSLLNPSLADEFQPACGLRALQSGRTVLYIRFPEAEQMQTALAAGELGCFWLVPVIGSPPQHMQLLNNHSYPNFTLAGGIQINPTVVCGPLPTPVVIPQDARLLPFAVHQGGEVLIIPGGVQWDSESAQTVVTAAMSSCLVWDDLAQVTIQGITAQVIRLEPLRNSQRFGVWSDRGWAPYLPLAKDVRALSSLKICSGGSPSPYFRMQPEVLSQLLGQELLLYPAKGAEMEHQHDAAWQWFLLPGMNRRPGVWSYLVDKRATWTAFRALPTAALHPGDPRKPNPKLSWSKGGDRRYPLHWNDSSHQHPQWLRAFRTWFADKVGATTYRRVCSLEGWLLPYKLIMNAEANMARRGRDWAPDNPEGWVRKTISQRPGEGSRQEGVAQWYMDDESDPANARFPRRGAPYIKSLTLDAGQPLPVVLIFPCVGTGVPFLVWADTLRLFSNKFSVKAIYIAEEDPSMATVAFKLVGAVFPNWLNWTRRGHKFIRWYRTVRDLTYAVDQHLDQHLRDCHVIDLAGPSCINSTWAKECGHGEGVHGDSSSVVFDCAYMRAVINARVGPRNYHSFQEYTIMYNRQDKEEVEALEGAVDITDASAMGRADRRRSEMGWPPVPPSPTCLRHPYWTVSAYFSLGEGDPAYTWPSNAGIHFLKGLLPEKRSQITSRGGHLYPPVFRSWTIFEGLHLYMRPRAARHGKTWDDLSVFEQWSVIGWIHRRARGNLEAFISRELLVWSFGLVSEEAQVFQQYKPCTNPGRCGNLWTAEELALNNEGKRPEDYTRGVLPCENCLEIMRLFGQAWDRPTISWEFQRRMRLFLEGLDSGCQCADALSGHQSPQHFCGSACCRKRVYGADLQGREWRSSPGTRDDEGEYDPLTYPAQRSAEQAEERRRPGGRSHH